MYYQRHMHADICSYDAHQMHANKLNFIFNVVKGFIRSKISKTAWLLCENTGKNDWKKLKNVKLRKASGKKSS